MSTPRYLAVLSILCVAKQDLDGPQIARLLVDHGGLGPAQRVGAVVLRLQSYRRHPFVNKPAILAGAQVA